MEQDKKVLVISQKDEQSTDKVLQYLLYNRVKFVRINEDDVVQNTSVVFDDKDGFRLSINNLSITDDCISSVWYRRGKINFLKGLPYKLSNEEYHVYQHYYHNSYKKEVDDLLQYIYLKLKDKEHINMFYDNFISKMVQLKLATKNGLKIPRTIVSDSLKEVIEFFEKSEIISKSIRWNIFSFSSNGNNYEAGMETSSLVDKEDLLDLINNNANKIQLSLFQEYIDKKFELRVFFLKGKFFPMAIFSQQDEATKIDWRSGSNRVSSFKLPVSLELKINAFMQDVNLNSGSLDFIYTPEREFVFLEVNPVGQFDWLSTHCNYFIEKHIADELGR